jgi:nucleotide-binding universal stress UspA family protein
MTYRSLLVLLDEAAGPDAAANAARALARDFAAHVVAVAPTGTVEVPVALKDASGLQDLAATAVHLLQKRARDAADRFAAACRTEGVASFETVIDEDDTVPAVSRRAHATDLVILGQPDPDRSDHSGRRAALEDVLLRIPAPALLVPYANAVRSIGTRVMIAWDGSRESTRAIADAMPLLQRAQHVEIVRWAAARARDDAARAVSRLDAMPAWLKLHGVTATVKTEVTESSVSDAMLSLAADTGVDLIVMGAYGHPLWTERLLGGATRGLLDAMTVPVFMSR